MLTGAGEIVNCYVEGGTVSGGSQVGGLIGDISDGQVSGCYSGAEVSAMNSSAGGVCGYSGGWISMCCSEGEISGQQWVGGLVGSNSGPISDCHSLATVSADSYVGGLIGRNSPAWISNCYSAGSVSGKSWIGGLVGYNDSGHISHCYWDIQQSGQTKSGGGTGKTTAVMKVQATFEGWDFVNVWDIVENETYPFLRAFWQEIAGRQIPMGEVVVDGDLSEWSDGVEWIALDKVYDGNPDDVSEAKYALRWDPDTDKIYAAVIVTDSDHVFSDEYIRWNASDRIEIYSQGDAEGGTGWLGTYDVAQQYMMGPNNSGGSWLSWAWGEVPGQDVGLEYAVTANGQQIIHEAGVLMFDNYGGFSGGETLVTELIAGHVVGFDILVSSRWGIDGFGMLSENLMTDKHQDAAQFTEYTLVERLGRSPYGPDAADLDKNGVVDRSDLVLLADNWLWEQ